MSYKNGPTGQIDVTEKVITTIQPILEDWIGGDIPLRPTMIYGIRRYLNGSKFYMHVDRLNTHIISAILQVDQVLV